MQLGRRPVAAPLSIVLCSKRTFPASSAKRPQCLLVGVPSAESLHLSIPHPLAHFLNTHTLVTPCNS